MSPRRRSAAFGCALIATATLVSCSLPVDDNARELNSASLPPVLVDTAATTVAVSPDPSASTTVPETSPYPVWFITGDHLEIVVRRVELGSSVTSLTEQLLRGPSADEIDRRALRTAIPLDAIESVDVRGGVATVDLAPSFSAIPIGDQILAVGQVVLTLTGFPGIGQVQFTVEGQPVLVPRADGSQGEGVVARDDYLPLVAV